MAARIEPTRRVKTSRSNSLAYLTKSPMEPSIIRQMTYSLMILKGVKPTPSTKQSGKIWALFAEGLSLLFLRNEGQTSPGAVG